MIFWKVDDRRYNRRNKLRELLIESELEPILENALPDSVENKLEPEVLATALLSEDEEIDLGSIRPEEVFKKLFLGSSSEVGVFKNNIFILLLNCFFTLGVPWWSPNIIF